MNPQEVATSFIRYFSNWTVSVTKHITFVNAKQCASKCCDEIINVLDDPNKIAFYEEVKQHIKEMKLA